MDKIEFAKASCLCGKVKIAIKNVENRFGACHCNKCKVWTGGPQMAIGCGENVEIEGEEYISKFASSDFAERAFCKECGTHLFYRIKKSNDHRVLLGLFKDSISPKFEYQYFIENKADTFSFADKTKNMTEKQILEYFSGL